MGMNIVFFLSNHLKAHTLLTPYPNTKQEMITRKIPWKGMEPAQIVIAVAKRNTRLEIPPDADPILKSIITSVWRANPGKRFGINPPPRDPI